MSAGNDCRITGTCVGPPSPGPMTLEILWSFWDRGVKLTLTEAGKVSVEADIGVLTDADRSMLRECRDAIAEALAERADIQAEMSN